MALIEEIVPDVKAKTMSSLLSGSVDMEQLYAYTQENELSAEETKTLLAKLETWLDIDYSNGPSRKLSLDLATLLFFKSSKDIQLDLMRVIAVYMNPNVSWSNAELAKSATLPVKAMTPHMQQYFQLLTPHLLNVRNPKLTAAGYKKTTPKTLGLQPALGLRYSTASEEGKRDEWKKSSDKKALSWVVPVIRVGKCWSGFDGAWPTITTFMINVLDDSDTYYRTLGCQLVTLFLECDLGDILIKSGLVHVFREAIEASLNFLPSLTPAPKSSQLLSAAYAALYQLHELNKATPIQFVEILDRNILGSISHVRGRGNDGPTNGVLTLLLEQAAFLISHHTKMSVLVCFSRLMFTLNQLIIDPFLVDADSGIEVVNAALKCHREILSVFFSSGDAEASALVLSYKYDFIGSWAILGKRNAKFGVGDSHTAFLLKQNVEHLRNVAKVTASEGTLECDLRETCAKVSEFQQYV